MDEPIEDCWRFMKILKVYHRHSELLLYADGSGTLKIGPRPGHGKWKWDFEENFGTVEYLKSILRIRVDEAMKK